MKKEAQNRLFCLRTCIPLDDSKTFIFPKKKSRLEKKNPKALVCQ